jgi:N-acetylglucosamine kinase-like BadF-type ATPase
MTLPLPADTTAVPSGGRVLAVDGGQSAIRVRHSGGPTTVEAHGVSREAGSDARVAHAVEAAWRDLGRPAVDRVVLGLTTAPADDEAAIALARRVGEAVEAGEAWLCDDAVTCHAGALSLGWGVSLAAGTGVACLAAPEHGVPGIIGGHGFLLGDEGGAFWIGREGLRAALRAAEGRAEPTALGSLAEARFGPLDRIPLIVHDDPRPVDEVARFAMDVLAASDTDPVAQRIVGDAASELHAVLRAAAHATSGRVTGPVPVALGGRLLLTQTPLRRALDARLAAEGNLDARTADGSPLDGALLLGSQPTPGRYPTLVHTWRREATS